MAKNKRLWLFLVLLILAGGYYLLRRSELLADNHRYVCHYENVPGLATGSRVSLRGVKVGKVEAIRLTPDKRVQVTLLLRKGQRLRKEDTAMLVSENLTGTKYIEILPCDHADYLEEWATVYAVVDTNIIDNFSATITPVIEEFKYMLRATDTGLNEVKQLVSTSFAERVVMGLIRTEEQTRSLSAISADWAKGTENRLNFLRRMQGIRIEPGLMDAGLTDSAGQHFRNLPEALQNAQATLLPADSQLAVIRSSEAVKDKTAWKEMIGSLDTLSRNMSELKASPPVISIFGKNHKK